MLNKLYKTFIDYYFFSSKLDKMKMMEVEFGMILSETCVKE